MSFAMIFMCCSAGCYCNVHVQVALRVQVHVLVVCRCSARSTAYVILVQLPGISWNLYDCKVSCTVFFFFFSSSFFSLFCAILFLHLYFFVRHLFYFFLCFFLSLSPMYDSFESISSRRMDYWRRFVDDLCLDGECDDE